MRFILFWLNSFTFDAGKVGMRHFHLTRQKYYRPIINCIKLWTLLPAGSVEKAQGMASKVMVIDCDKAGIFKVILLH
jgi:ribosomal protein L15